MTGKEALEILNEIKEIHNHLINNCDRSAFFLMGALTEKLSTIIRIDQYSFNPTVGKDERND